MKTTQNYGLKKPDQTDAVNIDDLNTNADKIDAELAKRMEKTGAATNATVAFTAAAARANIATGEKLSVIMGKIAKYFADLKVVAFSGAASDITQDATHRFVTDTEKSAWNGKMTAGGDASNTTVNTITASAASLPVPAAKDKLSVIVGKITKWQSDCLAKFGNYRTVTLKAASWTGTAVPYTQTVSVSGVTSTSELTLVSALADGAAAATQKAYSKAFGIVATGTATVGNGSVTFKVYKKPTTDIVVGLRGN